MGGAKAVATARRSARGRLELPRRAESQAEQRASDGRGRGRRRWATTETRDGLLAARSDLRIRPEQRCGW